MADAFGGWQGRRVLVTGAGGFVGHHVVRALAELGASVDGTGGPRPEGMPLAAWHDSDLLDPDSLATAVAQAEPDCLLHLAGQSSAARSFEHPLETFQVNSLGTWHLLEAARIYAPHARIVLVTSGEIYGAGGDGVRVAEDATQRPVSPYGISKAAADAFGAIASQRGQYVVRARSFGHAGPGQEPRFAIPAFAQQIANAEAGRGAPVLEVGNLDVVRDLCDVRDVALAYVALFERGKAGAAYNVCSGEGVRLTDVVRRLAAASRVPVEVRVDPARMRPADVRWLVGDRTAIGRDTGWSPAIPLDQTLADVLEDWRVRVRGAGA